MPVQTVPFVLRRGAGQRAKQEAPFTEKQCLS